MVVFSLTLLLNGFAIFSPGHWDTSNFITTYFGLVLFASLYLGHKICVDRSSPWLIPPEIVDLHSDIDEIEALEQLAAEPRELKWYMFWRRLFE